MPRDDSAPASPADPTPRHKAAGTAATLVLLVLHACLYGVSLLVVGLLVMVTDPCGYQKCGDPAWLNRAMTLQSWGGGVLLLVDVVAASYLLAKRRRAFVVPIVGCLAQVVLTVAAVAMEFQAGPV